MSGFRFQTRREFPGRAVVFLLLAAILITAAVLVPNVDLALGAVLPLSSGVALLLARPAEISAVLGADAIEFEHEQGSIPYDSIRKLWTFGRNPKKPRGRFTIFVQHENGVLTLARLEPGCESVYRNLVAKLLERTSESVPPILEGYLAKQIETFGADRVFAYRAGELRQGNSAYRAASAFFLGVIVACVVWLCAWLFFSFHNAWAAAAGALGVYTLLTLIVLRFAGRVGQNLGIKNWRESGIVIGPLGLAMTQGPMTGELLWEQLRDVELQGRSNSFRVSSAASQLGIVLRIDGADLLIADFYEAPLPIIYDRILKYWDPSRRETPEALD